MDRTILHCDCNAFYASVECMLRPELKKVPMAVCGDPESRRGIILAKNELAKSCGVQTAETIWQAKKKCPDLLLVPPHRREYERYSRLINGIYQSYTDLVEPFGIDESWLDVTGSRALFGDGVQIANRIREQIKQELGLTVSVGVSFNKIFAKLGSDYKKPDATTVISRETYRNIVYPLPVTALLFVGKSAAAVLAGFQIRTIGQLAAADPEKLENRLGKLGRQLQAYAAGLDDSPVRPAAEEREIKSIGNSITFRRNLETEEDIRLGVGTLSDQVASRLRRHGVLCRTVQVTIKDPDLRTITRQMPLETPTHLAADLSRASLALLRRSWGKRPIRMLGVAGMNLISEGEWGEQLSLWDQESGGEREKQEKLEAALDDIRARFGKKAISPAAILKNDLGIDR